MFLINTVSTQSSSSTTSTSSSSSWSSYSLRPASKLLRLAYFLVLAALPLREDSRLLGAESVGKAAEENEPEKEDPKLAGSKAGVVKPEGSKAGGWKEEKGAGFVEGAGVLELARKSKENAAGSLGVPKEKLGALALGLSCSSSSAFLRLPLACGGSGALTEAGATKVSAWGAEGVGGVSDEGGASLEDKREDDAKEEDEEEKDDDELPVGPCNSF